MEHLTIDLDPEIIGLATQPTIVPVCRGGSAAYREWEILIDNTHYCVVQEGEERTLLRKEEDRGEDYEDWVEMPDDVGEFLRLHNLVLGE